MGLWPELIYRNAAVSAFSLW